MTQDLIRIGHLLGPQGLSGAVRLFVIGDPAQLLGLTRVQLQDLGWRRVVSVTPHGVGVLLKLAGVDSRETAERLKGLEVFAHETELPPLPEGEYYYHQLIGLPVRSSADALLGTVKDVLDNGAQDLLVIERAGRTALVPLQADYLQILLGEAVVLDAPEGLLEDLEGPPEG